MQGLEGSYKDFGFYFKERPCVGDVGEVGGWQGTEC